MPRRRDSLIAPTPSPGGGTGPSPVAGLLAVLAIAAALRFIGLGSKSLWLDEIMSVRLARMPTLRDTVREVAAYDVHPPLYPIVHHAWMRRGGAASGAGARPGEGFARVPSAAFGVAAVGVVYLLARRLQGHRAGLAAAGLLAVSSYHIYCSQEARNYSLVVLLTLLLSWLLVVLVQSREKTPVWAWAAYALVGAACLYTFTMSALLIACHAALFLGLGRRGARNVLCGAGALAFIGVAFLPWWPVLRRATARMDWIARTQGTVGRPGPGAWLEALRQWMLAPAFVLPPSSGTDWALGAACLGLIAIALAAAPRRTGAMIAALIFGPIVLFLLLPIARVHRFDPKHLVFVQPVCLVAVASLAARSARAGSPASDLRPSPGPFPGGEGGLARLALLAGGLVALFNLAVLPLQLSPDLDKDGWARAAALIAEQERSPDLAADYVLVRPYAGAPQAFEYYYAGALRIWSGPVFGRTAHGEPVMAVPLPEFERVWLVGCLNEVIGTPPEVVRWFERHTRRVQAEEFYGAPGRVVWCALYERTPDTPPVAELSRLLASSDMPELRVRGAR